MKKSDRELVFNKFNGKCAYCGCELQKGWHVDELLPVRRGLEYVKDENGSRIWDANKGKYGDYKTIATVMHPERFHIDNQMPACASCNINKHSMTLEDFRNLISGFMKHLNEVNTQYKIAKRYGLVKEEIKPIVFYFETQPNK
jgi:5-methylcytosine-specific restriction endonuclease McrA